MEDMRSPRYIDPDREADKREETEVEERDSGQL